MASPGATLVADRRHFTIELWEQVGGRDELEVTRVYPIAIGMQGHRTESGLYQIVGKKKDPDWMMPHEDWVPLEDQGRIIPGGDPRNPIVSRWLLFDEEEGEGIHGTVAEWSLGSAASHGCIRMRVPDVEELFPKVPVGTILFIN